MRLFRSTAHRGGKLLPTVGMQCSGGFFMLRCIMLCFFCIISWRNNPLPSRMKAIATLYLNRLRCIVAAFRSCRIPIRSVILTVINTCLSIVCYAVFRVMFRHVVSRETFFYVNLRQRVADFFKVACAGESLTHFVTSLPQYNIQSSTIVPAMVFLVKHFVRN